MACYSEFHWSYQDVKRLPAQEAELLAIYLEEEARYTHKQRQEQERQATQTTPQERETTVLYLPDDDEE